MDEERDEIRLAIIRRGLNLDCYGWDDKDFPFGFGFDIEKHVAENADWSSLTMQGPPQLSGSDWSQWFTLTIVMPEPYKGEERAFTSDSAAIVKVRKGSKIVVVKLLHTRFGGGLDCVPTSF